MPPIRVIVPSWRDLRALGASKAVGLTIFVPIIGYYALYSETIGHYFQLNPGIFSSEPIENYVIDFIVNLPRPHILYFGLVFIAIGSLVYYALCPFLIKENESATAYFRSYEHAASSYEIEFVINRIARVVNSNDEYYRNWAKRIEQSYGDLFDLAGTAPNINDTLFGEPSRSQYIYDQVVQSRNHQGVSVKEQLRLALSAVTAFRYSIENRRRIFARFICTVFYVAGFILVGLASFQVMIQIILSMIR